MRRLIIPACIILLGCLRYPAQAHEWHSADGARSFAAQFSGLQDDQVILNGNDGKAVRYPLNLFAEADKQFARLAQQTQTESARMGLSAYEIQHVLEDGWLCRMGSVPTSPNAPLLFIGDPFFCLTSIPSTGNSGSQLQHQPLFPAGSRTYHPKEGDAITINAYATTLEAAVDERMNLAAHPDTPPPDVYEPVVEISTVQALGFCVGKPGLVVVNASLIKNVISLKIHAHKDEFPATIVKVSAKYGLALLSCGTELEPGRFAFRKPPELGQSIFVVSMSPKSTKKALGDPTLSKGIISKIKPGEIPRFDHDATTPADSLGGCILGEKGDVLGIFFANQPDPDQKEASGKAPVSECFSTEILTAFLQTLPNMAPLRTAPASTELSKNLEPLQDNMVLVTAQRKVNKLPKKIAAATAGGGGAGLSLSDSGVRHNAQCRYYRADKPCGANDGKPCKICGG
ncbi:hypothetical protein BH11VER1_BH11VER1_14990 [soil metagenome]